MHACMHCTSRLLGTCSCTFNHTCQVARALRFAPALEALADTVIAGILATGVAGCLQMQLMYLQLLPCCTLQLAACCAARCPLRCAQTRTAGVRAFNGLHLRIERDAADWTRIMGGHEAFWGRYLEAAAGAQLDWSTPLYLATVSSAVEGSMRQQSRLRTAPSSTKSPPPRTHSSHLKHLKGATHNIYTHTHTGHPFIQRCRPPNGRCAAAPRAPCFCTRLEGAVPPRRDAGAAAPRPAGRH